MNKGKISDRVSIFNTLGSAQEVIAELMDSLKEEYINFSTDSMNEGVLYLQGQKDMLKDIIKILKRERTYIYTRDCPELGKYEGDYYTNEFTGTIEPLIEDGLLRPEF